MSSGKTTCARSATVLLADENTLFRKLVREFLPEWATVVAECGDGDEALKLYRERRPDWVLMDLEVPPDGGPKATRAIKHAFPEAHVLIVSCHLDPEVREQARRAGAEHFVPKGELSRLEELLAQCHEDLKKHEHQTPGRAS